MGHKRSIPKMIEALNKRKDYQIQRFNETGHHYLQTEIDALDLAIALMIGYKAAKDEYREERRIADTETEA